MPYVGRTSRSDAIVAAFMEAIEDECETLDNGIVSDEYMAGYNAAREDMREHLALILKDGSDLPTE